MLVVTCRLDAKKSSIGQSATGGTEIQLPALLELWEISVEGLAALACFDPMCSFLIWSPWYCTMFHQKESRSTSEMKALQLQCLMPRQPHTGLVDATDVDSQDLFEERLKAWSRKISPWNELKQPPPRQSREKKKQLFSELAGELWRTHWQQTTWSCRSWYWRQLWGLL